MTKNSAKYDQFKKKVLDWVNTFLEKEGLNFCFEVHLEKVPDSESNDIKEVITLKLRMHLRKSPSLIKRWKANFDTRLFGAEEYQAVLDTFKDAKTIDNDEIWGRIEVEIAEKLGQMFWKGKPYQQLFVAALFNSYPYIDSIDIRNFYSIKHTQLRNLKDTKEIYFLGENGDGKTLLLSAIHLCFASQGMDEPQVLEQVGAALSLLQGSKGSTIGGMDSMGNDYVAEFRTPYYLPNFITYGPNRGLYSASNFDETGFMSLYSNEVELCDPTRLLELAVTGEMVRDSGRGGNGNRKTPKLGNISSGEIIAVFHELLENNVEITLDNEALQDWFRFKEKGSGDLRFKHLSEGYKNLLIWVGDLLLRLQAGNPEITKIADFKGVVVVDEIELHLHPQWQLTLVGKLRTFFPGIQFIFSTHSPTIVQGAGDDAVIYRVYRNKETGITSVSEPYFKKDMAHMMYNTLVTSPLFGLESARISPETDEPDTSDSYLSSRVARAVSLKVQEQKAAGKTFVSRELIDQLIQEVLNEELGK